VASQKSKIPQRGQHLVGVSDALDHVPRVLHRACADHDPLEVRAKRPQPGKRGSGVSRSHCLWGLTFTCDTVTL
jgi:hypothetical protein